MSVPFVEALAPGASAIAKARASALNAASARW
jgi:hypothetical protein